MPNEKKKGFSPLQIGLMVLGALVLLRFAGPLRFLIVTLAIAGAVGFLIYLAYEFVRQQRAKSRQDFDLPEGVAQRLQQVEQQVKANEAEMRAIRKSLRELRQEVRNEDALNVKNRSEAQYLIREFEAELELRQAKISFYRTAGHKLNRLLYNRQFSQSLAEKEAELRRLKENHYEDLADMESLRSDVELEILYLDTIDELSLKVPENLSLEHVQQLQLQLEEMTRGLER